MEQKTLLTKTKHGEGYCPKHCNDVPDSSDIRRSSEKPPKHMVVVLGMHRSGTSVITHILSEAGFFVGEEADLMKGNQWNRNGYFERWSVLRANNHILGLCNGLWHAPPQEDGIVRTNIDHELEPVLNVYRGRKQAVMKDPRLCLTLPAWRRVLDNRIQIVTIRRGPDAVAASLMRRNGFSRQKSLFLWEIYNERASRYARVYSHFSLQYEELFSERREEVLHQLSSFIGIEEDLERIAVGIIDPSLRHCERRRSPGMELDKGKEVVPTANKKLLSDTKHVRNTRRWWNYAKFAQNEVKVLLVSLRHLLLSEVMGALKRSGHECNVLMIGDKEMDRTSVEESYITAIKEFRPDFVLTINHLGFDQEGTVTGLLTGYQIPFASWYVDSPHLIIRHYEGNTSPYLTLFLWDKDYVQVAEDLGFDRVEYLPLGVDEKLFYPIASKNNLLAPLCPDVSFVGNSMVVKVESVLKRSNVNGILRKNFDEVSSAFRMSHHLVVRDMMKEQFPELVEELVKLPEPQALAYEAGVTWQATGWYRLAMVKKLEQFRPLIVGDKGWREILHNGYQLHSELNYYRDLPFFYNKTRISFNATSRQMKNGVNQRVFDVPACKSVVLTDWTVQLESLMEPNRDVLAYKHGNEIPDLINRALHDRRFYKQIASSGYKRVSSEHTYRHRLQQLIKVMRANYA